MTKSGAKGNGGNVLSQYVTPALLATGISVVATFVTNWYVERDKVTEASRTHKETFIKLLTERILDHTKALTEKSTNEDEQQAAVTLLALDGLAETESEHEAVLLIGARLLNANSKRGDSGGPAARFLDTAIGQIHDKAAAPGPDHAMYSRLLASVKSSGFVDLVTAGLPVVYYGDNPEQDFQPTLYGDTDVGVGAKDRLLALIGPDHIEGWIYVASWKTHHRIKTGSAQGINRFSQDVGLGKLQLVAERRDQYAVPPIVAGSWLRDYKVSSIRILSPRLLRDGPPLTYAEGSEPTLKGTLGRVIGIVPVRTCVDADQPRPVIVYVDTKRVDPKARGGTMDALIHLWVHVTESERCPAA